MDDPADMRRGTDDGGDVGNGAHVDVVALVLGQVDAPLRAEMAAHLLVCSMCRTDYDEMSAAIGELLPVVPAVQPPLGFDARVLHHLGITSGPKRAARTWWLASAAAGLIVLVAAVGWWTTSNDSTNSAGNVSSLELVDGGGSVGTVSISNVGGEQMMVVALVGPPGGVSYRCRTTFADGTTTESDPWPAVKGAWLVPLPSTGSSDIDKVELVVADTNDVWSIADF